MPGKSQVQVDGLSKPILSLADRFLMKKFSNNEEEKSGPICTEFAADLRFSDLADGARQRSPKLKVHSKSSQLSPRQVAGVDGHPSHEDLSHIDRVLSRRHSIQSLYANNLQIERSRRNLMGGLQGMNAEIRFRTCMMDSLITEQMQLVWKCVQKDLSM